MSALWPVCDLIQTENSPPPGEFMILYNKWHLLAISVSSNLKAKRSAFRLIAHRKERRKLAKRIKKRLGSKDRVQEFCYY
jgi:hypothetical protein